MQYKQNKLDMKFSITIPTYKATFLTEAIESCLAQTYTDFELIIVDDASPENIAEIVQQYNDPRIRYYRNEQNYGAIDVVKNWNKCLSYATGEYVICMGDDDRLLPNCLEEYVKLMKLHPGLGVYHAWTEIIDENTNIVSIQEARPEYEGVCCMMWERLERGRQQFIGDFCFDTTLLKSCNGFYYLPLAWGSDDISAFRAAVKGIANTQKPTFQYRINSQTISKRGNAEIKLKAVNQSIMWYQDFLNTYTPTNYIESIFITKLKKRFEIIMTHKRLDTIIKDLQINFRLSRMFFWFCKRRKYNYSSKIFLYALLEATKSHAAGTTKSNLYL